MRYSDMYSEIMTGIARCDSPLSIDDVEKAVRAVVEKSQKEEVEALKSQLAHRKIIHGSFNNVDFINVSHTESN